MKVLYAIDGSPGADAARRLFTQLFRRDGVEVTVVSVTHSWSLAPEHLLLEVDPIAERRVDSQKLADFAKDEFERAGFVSTTAVLEGHPAREVIKLASDQFDLVVVGAGSHSWLGNLLLGSVSTLVLHEAPCSILIVHEAQEQGSGRIVVGVDGSMTSDQTVTMLIRTLDPGRCSVEVISVSESYMSVLTPIPLGPPPVPNPKVIERVDEESRSRAQAAVDSAAEEFRDAGFTLQARVLQGSAAAVLLEESKEMRADLVAVGSRGLGPIRRAFLGSVSDHVARHAAAAFVGRFAPRDESA